MKIENDFAAMGGKDNIRNDQKRIEELQKRREGIMAFRDITAEDRRILEGIDQEIENLESDKEATAEDKKKELFTLIDIMQGVYSQTHDRTIPAQEMKMIINDVLKGTAPINRVPRSVVFKREKNLRELVKDLM